MMQWSKVRAGRTVTQKRVAEQGRMSLDKFHHSDLSSLDIRQVHLAHDDCIFSCEGRYQVYT